MGRWPPYSETDEFARVIDGAARCIVDRGSKGGGKRLIGLKSRLKCISGALEKNILERNIDRVGHEERPKCLSGANLSAETLS